MGSTASSAESKTLHLLLKALHLLRVVEVQSLQPPA
jgi:hypothetical protein